jgi:hypothetical protein
MRYWLSVGATPTNRVQRLLEKFDFVPKAHTTFGSQHSYAKKEHIYGVTAFREMKGKINLQNRMAFFYRA